MLQYVSRPHPIHHYRKQRLLRPARRVYPYSVGVSMELISHPRFKTNYAWRALAIAPGKIRNALCDGMASSYPIDPHRPKDHHISQCGTHLLLEFSIRGINLRSTIGGHDT